MGRSFLHILETKGDVLRDRYGLDVRVVAALDRSAAWVNPDGLPIARLREHKAQGGRLIDLPGAHEGWTVAEVLNAVEADVVIDASPVNLETGEPGLPAARAALSRGLHVVFANKGPLVMAYQELHALAERAGRRLAFSATVCGGLPVINIGRRDLVAAHIRRFRGVVNSTTNYILDAMAEGQGFAEALAEAQRRGIAEADPSLDVDGWDAAEKLVIVANAVLGMAATLDDVARVEGIRDLSPQEVQAARRRGQAIKLVATAEWREDGRYRLEVAPQRLPAADFLAQVRGWEMGVVFETDIYEVISAKIDERGPMATAAAVLRDLVAVCAGSG